MRVVIFSINYPPLRNPRSFRVSRYFSILREQGEILLFTSPVKGVELKEPGVVRTGFRVKLYSNFRKRLKEYRLVKILHDRILPDDKVLYQIWHLFYYFVKCRRKEDLIITVSNPFSSHLIGLTLKYLFRHQWIADIGDVYADITEGRSIFKWKCKFEKKVVQKADHIIVNAQGLKKYYLNRGNLEEQKISIILNGVAQSMTKIKHMPSETLRLSYIGNTYGGIREGKREMEILFKALSQQTKLKYQIQLVGTQFHELEKLGIQHSESVLMSTCKSDEELIDSYSKTDILINFANVEYPGLPSKLEEYVASRLPIVNFFHSTDEASIQYLNAADCKVFHVNLYNPDIEKLNAFFITAKQEIHVPQHFDPAAITSNWMNLLSRWRFPS